MKKARRSCADCANMVRAKIVLARRALAKAEKIGKSDRRIAKSLDRRIDELRENPIPPSARKMEGEEFVYRIPFHGDYGRIIYEIISDARIEILIIGTREEVYPQWLRFAEETRE